MPRFQPAMLIPGVSDLPQFGWSGQAGQLDEPDSSLDQSPRQQALLCISGGLFNG